MTDVRLLAQALRGGAAAWLVRVESTEGSAPREPGAWMAVLADRVIGTIGGGHLEHQAMADARRRLAGEPGEPQVRYALGPALGQCCGGVVHLQFEALGPADAASLPASLPARLQGPRTPVALFGGGACRPRAGAGAGPAALCPHMD